MDLWASLPLYDSAGFSTIRVLKGGRQLHIIVQFQSPEQLLFHHQVPSTRPKAMLSSLWSDTAPVSERGSCWLTGTPWYPSFWGSLHACSTKHGMYDSCSRGQLFFLFSCKVTSRSFWCRKSWQYRRPMLSVRSDTMISRTGNAINHGVVVFRCVLSWPIVIAVTIGHTGILNHKEIVENHTIVVAKHSTDLLNHC